MDHGRAFGIASLCWESTGKEEGICPAPILKDRPGPLPAFCLNVDSGCRFRGGEMTFTCWETLISIPMRNGCWSPIRGGTCGLLVLSLCSFLFGTKDGGSRNEFEFMQLSELNRIPLEARIAVLGDFSARAIDWKGIFPGNPVELFLVDDFATQQLGWVVEDFIRETRPEICIFTGGAVDAALRIPPSRVVDNLEQISGQLREVHVEPYFLLPVSIVYARPEAQNRLIEIRQAQAEWALERGVRIVKADAGSEAVFDPVRITRARVQRILGDSVATPRILMLGDSLTEGGGDWNARLGRTDMRNAGQGGYASGQILWLLSEPVIEDSIRTAFITAGINDLSMGIEEGILYENLLKICRLLRSRGIRVVLQSTLYQQDDPETNTRLGSLNERLRRFCSGGAATFLDLNAHLAGPSGLKAAYTTDGTHLNEAGYAVWEEVLTKSGLLPGDVPLENLILPGPGKVEGR